MRSAVILISCAILSLCQLLSAYYPIPQFTSTRGNQHFVSAAGLDTNAGNISMPFLTIGKALSVVLAGEIIYVRGGTYNLTAKLKPSRNGTSTVGNQITVTGYPNETVRRILHIFFFIIYFPRLLSKGKAW
jgi:hypothetical protein